MEALGEVSALTPVFQKRDLRLGAVSRRFGGGL